MTTGSGQDSDADNPLRELSDILSERVKNPVRPRSETDRRSNYKRAPVPPGVKLNLVSIAEATRRDEELIQHVHEVARATAVGHATDRRTVRVDVGNPDDIVEILDYLDAHRDLIPGELRERVDATADRLRRCAYAELTTTRLVCPHCGQESVVPTPGLSRLVCLDYTCAPLRPRVIDPTQSQPADRLITARQLALIVGEVEGTMRKRLWRAHIEPADKGRQGQHSYRWADVKHLVSPAVAHTGSGGTGGRADVPAPVTTACAVAQAA